MKQIFAVLALLVTTQFAQASVGDQCAELGKQKLASQAEAFGIEIDQGSFQLSEEDQNWIGPSYAWYTVAITNLNGRTDVVVGQEAPFKLTEMVQLSFGKCY